MVYRCKNPDLYAGSLCLKLLNRQKMSWVLIGLEYPISFIQQSKIQSNTCGHKLIDSAHSWHRRGCTWWSSASGFPEQPHSATLRRDAAVADGWWSPSCCWRRSPSRPLTLPPVGTHGAEWLSPQATSPGRGGLSASCFSAGSFHSG